ncbi:UNVERIFIED_CONTAM: hypothetical protein PYX00_009878 [Menopon gallinae]|uniref:Carbohydrate sulfotransferase n=1 Tax=Menopon gallinae TaxID=328185 RepID=A0AAW2HCT8_9NEOP
MIRFKLKMLVAVAIGAFTAFTMLLYAISESARCDSNSSILCFYVNKEDDLATRNVSFRVAKSASDFRRRYQIISRSRVYNIKVETTERFGNLRAPPDSNNVTPGDTFRTRRNIYYGARTSRLNFVTSSVVQRKPTEVFPILSSGQIFSKYTTSDKKSSNEISKEDDYLYLTQNLVSLLNNEKLNASLVNDTFRYYAERQQNLHVGCRKYYNASEILKVKRVKLDHILIDENRKVLFCYVPKVACTNWKRIFMLLTGKASNISQVMRIPSYKVHARNLFTSLQNYSAAEVDQILRDYTKFIFVRNPFERLLSAYHNKLEQHYDSSKYFQARFGKYIIKKFRKNPSNVSLEKGDDVTFSEFVDYLTSSDSSSYNEHWQTVTNLCHPCFINYDLIGKYETLISDSSFVLDYLKLNFSFPVLEKPSRTASSLKKYFNVISKDVIYKLYRIYEMDFKLFGYDLFKTLDWTNES